MLKWRILGDVFISGKEEEEEEEEVGGRISKFLEDSSKNLGGFLARAKEDTGGNRPAAAPLRRFLTIAGKRIRMETVRNASVHRV